MKIFLFILSITFLVSCNQNNNEIELIRLTKQSLLVSNELHYPSHPETGKSINNAINNVAELIKKDFTSKSRPLRFIYYIYINEEGLVSKVFALTSISKKIDEFLLHEMKNWKLDKLREKEPIQYICKWEFGFRWDGNELTKIIQPQINNSNSDFGFPNQVYFVAVEQMPEPIGGIKAIQSKITYPEIAKRAGIQGRVFIKAFVDETGKVTKASVIKGIGAGCDEAATDAVMKTKFTPGKQRDKFVKVQIAIPIMFKLNPENGN